MCIHPPFGGWIGIYKNLWCVIPLPPTIDWGLQLLKMIRFITHTSGGGKLSWIRICMCVRVYVCVCLSVCVCVCIYVWNPAGKYLFVLFFVRLLPPFIAYKGPDLVRLFGWFCFVFVCLICLAHRTEKVFSFLSFFFLSWNAVCTEVSLNTHNTKKKSGSFSLLSPTSLLLVSVNICSVWLYFLTLMVNSPALCENYRWLRKKGSQKQPNAELQTFNQGKRRILFPHIFSAIIQQAHNRAHKQQIRFPWRQEQTLWKPSVI